MWWNRHGDASLPHQFYHATLPLYSSSAALQARWVSRDRLSERSETARRLSLLAAGGDFDRVYYELLRWTVTLTTAEVRGLWGTFGEVSKMTPRRRKSFLDGIERIAREEFGGTVVINMRTPLYTARRR
jgi:hypothetical protein